MINRILRKIARELIRLSQEKTHINAVLEPGVVLYANSQINNFSGNKEKIVIKNGTHIAGILQVFSNAGEIQIGENTFVGEFSRIYSARSITIGNNVQIAHNVNIFDNNIHSTNPTERQKEFLQNTQRGFTKLHDLNEKEVIIKDNVWIGANSIILKGVTIGENSIIGAGSVVTSDIPSNVIAVGNPAMAVKTI